MIRHLIFARRILAARARYTAEAIEIALEAMREAQR